LGGGCRIVWLGNGRFGKWPQHITLYARYQRSVFVYYFHLSIAIYHGITDFSVSHICTYLSSFSVKDGMALPIPECCNTVDTIILTFSQYNTKKHSFLICMLTEFFILMSLLHFRHLIRKTNQGRILNAWIVFFLCENCLRQYCNKQMQHLDILYVTSFKWGSISIIAFYSYSVDCKKDMYSILLLQLITF